MRDSYFNQVTTKHIFKDLFKLEGVEPIINRAVKSGPMSDRRIVQYEMFQRNYLLTLTFIDDS